MSWSLKAMVFEEDKDEYLAEKIFFVPENARWSVIAGAARTEEIGQRHRRGHAQH